jgi:hypothetical protein
MNNANTTTREAKSLRSYMANDIHAFRRVSKKRANRLERRQGKKLCACHD